MMKSIFYIARFAVAFALCVFVTLGAIGAEERFGPAPGKKIKLFILSGQSNMGGQGESKKLPAELRDGNSRVLMFHDGRWQPLVATAPHKKHDSLTFGPEIAFAHRIAKAHPNETIGIVKHANGGTGILAWSPTWTKAQADRTKDGKKGDLFKELTEKVKAATVAAPCEIKAFAWMQGGKDTQYDTGPNYLQYLTTLVGAIRENTGQRFLPFVLGSYRNGALPDDLTSVKNKIKSQATPDRPYDYEVLQAQYDIQKVAPPARMVPLHDLPIHGNGNLHYNTEGQLELGKLLAEAYLDMTGG